MTPYLSLACIVGDSGVGTLGRMLKSVLQRTKGPLVDEVIIAWNGANDRALADALHEAAMYFEAPFELGEGPGSTTAFRGWRPPGALLPEGAFRPLPLTVLRQKWKGRFDVARNESFALARGEWVMWLDSDDVVSDAGDAKGPDGLRAIQAVERDYGLPTADDANAPKTTLKDWLKSLPYQTNAVLTPYDYAIDANGYVLTRVTSKRVVRRSAGFIWRNPIHEVLYPTGAVGEASVPTFGLLVRHYPKQAVLEKVARNREVVMALETAPGDARADYADARYFYDLANAKLTLGDLRGADTALAAATMKADNPLDLYTYLLARGSVLATSGNHPAAAEQFLKAIGVRPEVSDAYFALAEMHFLAGQWSSVIRFNELGCAMAPDLGQRDQPYAKWVQPRAQNAVANLNLGKWDEALRLATQAVERYPEDPFAKATLEQAKGAQRRAKAFDAVFAVVEYALEGKSHYTAESLVQNALGAVAFRGIESDPRMRALRQRVEDATGTQLERSTPGILVPCDTHGARIPPPKELEAAFPGVEVLRLDSEDALDARCLVDAAVELEGNTGRQLVGQGVTAEGSLVAYLRTAAKAPVVHFYCPYAVDDWRPSDVEVKGLGGSEGSVAYLARELAKRGWRVRTYTPGGPKVPEAVEGVLECALLDFDPKAATAAGHITVAHRAPFVLRDPRLDPSRVVVWHQDNGYASEWLWNREVEKLSAGSLHVSKFAREGLLRELGAPLGDKRHVVVGNGVAPFCVAPLRKDAPLRNPKKVVYASDPTRGLEALLAVWPKVLELEPEAELFVAGSWKVWAALQQQAPGIPEYERVGKVRLLLRSLPRIHDLGWVPHAELVLHLLSAGVYAYPGGPMPEGYGVSLVQAAAAGCAVVYPEAGALPEVLPDPTFMLRPTPGIEPEGQLLAAIVAAIRQGDVLPRVENALRTWETQGWPKTADRVEAALRTLIPSEFRS